MNYINKSQIDMDNLNKLSNQGSNATLYTDGNICYKLLNTNYPTDKLLTKFREMDGINIDNVLLPKEIIMNNDKMVGYTMDYIPNSKELSDKYLVRRIDCLKLFRDLENASKILKSIHDTGVICTDLSFENILVNNKDDIYFCDIDGCTYKHNIGPSISLVLNRFILDYKQTYMYINENSDKLCMILSFILLLFNRELQTIPVKDYKKYASVIKTLKNLEPYFLSLQNRKERTIPTLPYLDEIIDKEDDFLVDRFSRKR